MCVSHLRAVVLWELINQRARLVRGRLVHQDRQQTTPRRQHVGRVQLKDAPVRLDRFIGSPEVALLLGQFHKQVAVRARRVVSTERASPRIEQILLLRLRPTPVVVAPFVALRERGNIASEYSK